MVKQRPLALVNVPAVVEPVVEPVAVARGRLRGGCGGAGGGTVTPTLFTTRSEEAVPLLTDGGWCSSSLGSYGVSSPSVLKALCRYGGLCCLRIPSILRPNNSVSVSARLATWPVDVQRV